MNKYTQKIVGQPKIHYPDKLIEQGRVFIVKKPTAPTDTPKS
jgi:hypothetical protein